MNRSTIKQRVAFQGARGAFSEAAATKLLGADIQLVPRPTFESLFAAIDEGLADCVLAPIENSLVGSIQRSYDLLSESSLLISGEVVIRIAHCLIGCPGASFDRIRTVESHPVALAQCENFFHTHPQIIRLVTEDTAGSVAQVVERGDITRAAIAGKQAAEVYGGVILREHLEDQRENYTRFVLLAPSKPFSEEADKLSLIIKLPHQPAALAQALEPFARRNMDLLKIETRPIKDCPWEYFFHLDLRASIKDSEVADALRELKERTTEVRIMGCYPSAQIIETESQHIGRLKETRV